ncbi:hypothetical protein [Streptomyces sp. NPDC001657]
MDDACMPAASIRPARLQERQLFVEVLFIEVRRGCAKGQAR